MAILPIIYEPDEVLRKIAKPVTVFDYDLKKLISDMFETMYACNACGLAAPQIGESLSLTVINMSPERDPKEQLVLVNPEIIEGKGEQYLEVGCLSVPGVGVQVKRHAWVKVKAQNEDGHFIEVTGEHIFSECLQHELDHLKGILFTDYLSPEEASHVLEKSRLFRKNQVS